MVRKGFVALFIAGEKVGEGDEFSNLCGPSAVGRSEMRGTMAW